MSATREAYIRGYWEKHPMDCHIGLEWRAGDDYYEIADRLKQLAFLALNDYFSHRQIVAWVEENIIDWWPDRAYFIETDEDGKGVQVYQPFGMPRNRIGTCDAP